MDKVHLVFLAAGVFSLVLFLPVVLIVISVLWMAYTAFIDEVKI